MHDLSNTLWIEGHKAIRSKVPLLTALGFLLVPMVGAFLMLIYKDPEFARQSGLISAKANLMAGTADWPTYLNLLAQAIAIGGIMLFSLIGSWVFGREFADGTLKDLLAVPVGRGTILLAKFLVMAAWSAALTVMVYIVGVALGALVVLPKGSPGVFLQGAVTLTITACLVVLAVIPIVFFASVGRGYLLPLGVAMLVVLLGNIAIVIGWGDYFPWAIPALYAGMAGERGTNPQPVSYVLVILAGLGGMLATYLWWKYADQSR